MDAKAFNNSSFCICVNFDARMISLIAVNIATSSPTRSLRSSSSPESLRGEAGKVASVRASLLSAPLRIQFQRQ
jgi:hypothetical protein